MKRILSVILSVLVSVLFAACGGAVEPIAKQESNTVTPPVPDPVNIEPEPEKISGNIVFYCDVPEYEKIEDMEELENAVKHMQEQTQYECASVSVWLREGEDKGKSKEYYAALYENAANVLALIPYTDISPNAYAPFVSMGVPYAQLSANVLAEVAENELIAMLIVSHPMTVVPG